ncbi:MAG: hypothetical protein WKF83_04415 [Nocardioidaceae bacterium]
MTEYSLSVDNLFVFIVLMSALQVPRKYQQEALMVGIVLALVLRGIFIAVGAVAINNVRLDLLRLRRLPRLHRRTGSSRATVRTTTSTRRTASSAFAREHLNATDEYHGLKLFIKENGRRMMTPMFLVILALGTTDLLFALDSIPAIYGLTEEPYIVFTANVFALMGLRQLYFLLGGLLERLVYLSLGLSHHLGVHRRQAGAARPARERAAFHQRWRARARVRDPDPAQPRGDRRDTRRNGRLELVEDPVGRITRERRPVAGRSLQQLSHGRR